MIEIEKIALKQLPEFVKSVRFQTFVNHPISKQRILSYIYNPRATNQEDFVLYMAFKNDELIGYRTLLVDAFFEGTESTKFVWLSGSWVHKKYRRSGVSTFIFNEIHKDWKGKLMYTNYAVASKKLYDKTSKFKELSNLKGTRYYLRFCSADILPKKASFFKKIQPVLKGVDNFLNIFLKGKSKNKKIEPKIDVLKSNRLITAQNLFLNDFKSTELYQRDTEVYNWVHQYPWIATDEISKKDSKNYYFSLYAKQFSSDFYTFYNQKNKIVAIVLLTIKDGALKIPYTYLTSKTVKEVAGFVINLCQEKKIKYLTIFNKELQKELNKKLFYLTKKPFEQRFFVTKVLLQKHPLILEKNIQSGDGDVVFT